MDNINEISLRLDLIVAKVALLRSEYQNGKLWPGDLNNGLREVVSVVYEVLQLSGGDQ